MDAHKNTVGGLFGDLDPCGGVELFLTSLVICTYVVQKLILGSRHNYVYALTLELFFYKLGDLEVKVLFKHARSGLRSAVLAAVTRIEDNGRIFLRLGDGCLDVVLLFVGEEIHNAEQNYGADDGKYKEI